MTVAFDQKATGDDLLATFRGRCTWRAQQVRQGQIGRARAAELLQCNADMSGLVEQIGQDLVQAIIANSLEAARSSYRNDEYDGLSGSFARACRIADRQQRKWQNRQPNTEIPKHRVHESTLMAAEYLVRLGDVARFKNWLFEHSQEDVVAIVEHVEHKLGAP